MAMKLFDDMKKMNPEDLPIYEIKDQDKVLPVLQKVKTSISIDELSKITGLSNERILEINNEMSIHFKDNLAPKVFFKAMLKSTEDTEEFKMFFQRTDVDLCCNIMFKIEEVFSNMRHLNSPTYLFLKSNWEKYRGY
jgi:hypothetical protein